MYGNSEKDEKGKWNIPSGPPLFRELAIQTGGSMVYQDRVHPKTEADLVDPRRVMTSPPPEPSSAARAPRLDLLESPFPGAAARWKPNQAHTTTRHPTTHTGAPISWTSFDWGGAAGSPEFYRRCALKGEIPDHNRIAKIRH